MKVLYDYQAFTWQKYGGVSNCFAKLISNLPKDVEYEIAIKECDNVHLKEANICDVHPYRLYGDNFITKRFFPGKYRLYRWFTKLFPTLTADGLNRRAAVHALQEGNFDIFHPTFFDPYFLQYIGNKPFVLTIHDMIPELVYERKDDPQVARKKLLAEKASHIIAVSEKTKEDIMDVLHIPEGKISVVYHGAPEVITFSNKRLFDFDYVLFVGGRNQSYKNFQPMVKSIAPILKKRNVHLICTGNGFTTNEKELFTSLGLTGLVHHQYVSDSELGQLYHQARCFIFPSLYEGFGIPILEAYKAGCPVLLNNKSCFPEIADDAAVYFELDNYQNTLGEVLDDFLKWSLDTKELLLQRQAMRVKLFSWKKSAERLASIYEKCF
jgi:glycosyltransferase involved in cell wall biosynthesis